jgi:hypothetical protein
VIPKPERLAQRCGVRALSLTLSLIALPGHTGEQCPYAVTIDRCSERTDMETRKFLNRVFDFRKNWPFLAGFAVFWITCLVFGLGFVLELAGVHGEGGSFMIIFLPLIIPGGAFCYMLGLTHPAALMLISCVINAAIIWSAAFVVQTLALVFLKVFKRNRIEAKF